MERYDTIESFGKDLIRTGDLDPIYIALNAMRLPVVERNRWLLAYVCYYHAGFACYATEAPDTSAYWARLAQAAFNDPDRPTPFGERWPRGSERRHTRGDIAKRMVAELSAEYGDSPEGFIPRVNDETCRDVIKKVRVHYNFGPWIAFKVADLLDRCCGSRVDFSDADIFLFDSPKEAAELIRSERGLANHNDVMTMLRVAFSGMLAPPDYQRPIGNAEVETVLCKWKSHINGHYPMGHDIEEIRRGVAPWAPHSTLAVEFMKGIPA